MNPPTEPRADDQHEPECKLGKVLADTRIRIFVDSGGPFGPIDPKTHVLVNWTPPCTCGPDAAVTKRADDPGALNLAKIVSERLGIEDVTFVAGDIIQPEQAWEIASRDDLRTYAARLADALEELRQNYSVVCTREWGFVERVKRAEESAEDARADLAARKDTTNA